MSSRTKYHLAVAWRLGLVLAVAYLGEDLGRGALQLWGELVSLFCAIGCIQ